MIDDKTRSYLQQQVDFDNAELGKLDTSDGYNCNKCKNKGWIAQLSEQGSEIKKDCECMKIRYHAREKDNCGKIGFIKDDIGKTVFLTKEEAEQALAEMKGV